MSIFSKALRGVAVAGATTIARPLLGEDGVAWIKQKAAEERAEEAEAKAAKARRRADALSRKS